MALTSHVHTRDVPRDRPALSVLILALDEEVLIERCLRSVAWADEVVVVDSGSTDRTREIAERLGARVVDQPWLGFSAQRTAATAAARHDWVMFIDADEVVSPELAESIQAVMAAGPDPADGYSVDRRTEWLGDLVPNEQRRSMVVSFVRVFHRGRSHYDPDMVVHERAVVPGRERLLEGTLVQWRAETLGERTERAARYAVLEAQLADQFHDKRASVRRAAVLPVLRLLWLLFARRNVFGGTRGVLHALHKTNGEWMRQVLLFEQQDRGGLTAGEVLARALHDNDLPAPDRRGLARLVPRWLPVWWAVPRLVATSLRVLGTRADDVTPMADAYESWNVAWLRAGKAWEAKHTHHAVHPPGYDPTTPTS